MFFKQRGRGKTSPVDKVLTLQVRHGCAKLKHIAKERLQVYGLSVLLKIGSHLKMIKKQI